MDVVYRKSNINMASISLHKKIIRKIFEKEYFNSNDIGTVS